MGGEGFVYNGDGEGNFLKSLHIVGRGVLTPYIVCPLPLLQILSTSPPTSLSPETPPPSLCCSFCCPVSLAKWVITLHLMCYFILLNNKGLLTNNFCHA